MLEGEFKPLLPARLEPKTTKTAVIHICEGRYHQVRRMFAAAGNHVVKLHRRTVDTSIEDAQVNATTRMVKRYGRLLDEPELNALAALTPLEAALVGVDPRLEQAAATLGASRWRILRTVTLPAIRPALAAGLALCWARGLGEFGATITFAGNLEGRTQTMPLAVYDALQTDPEAAIALGLVLLAVSLTLLTALRGQIGRR